MFNVLATTEGLDYLDWLELRNQGIGGSDASVICGINKWKSAVELWAEKTGQVQSQEAGEAAYWGTQLEALVRAEFTKRTGHEVTPVNQLLQSVEHPFMLANLDGVCQHPIYGTCVFEAKTASAYKVSDWDDDKIPDPYMLQLQHYLAVTGYKGAYIAVLIGGNTFRWKFIERDDALIEMLIKIEAEFWDRVQDGTPPPLDGSEASADFLKARFPDSVPLSTVELPEDAANLIMQYEYACQEEEDAKERKQQASNMLKQMLGENEAGTVGDRTITWKSITQERLDTTTLKVEHPTLYKKFANKSSYRRFSVKTAA